ncbi:MAG: FAD-dependent oxidoreductase [Chromatiales bacterium]
MNPVSRQESPLTYNARPNGAAHQDTLPGRYRWWVMTLSMAAFTLAFVGWLNESWLYLFESPIWLNRYTEYAIILAFGLWRIRAEQNPYTRKRLIILVTVVTGFWWLIPWLMPMFEPYAGYVWSQPVFPALHTPGTLTFLLTLILVFLFGRRIICGFGCPCVGVRETVGFPFRRFSLRSDWACTRNQMEGAVTIGAVERTLAERALEAGWRPIEPSHRNGRKVAVIGAGPAGLSCAERLNRTGVEVTVYDRSNKIGGLLQTGVPSFKLDKALLARRQTLLEQAGIRFNLGLSVDEVMLSHLLEQNDAIFLGLGAQKPRSIELPGETLSGVEQALGWLDRINAGERESLTGQRVLVIGGGDTAMDCARSALRLGAEVSVAYRGPEECLRASPKEVKLAREEGARFLFQHIPLECEGAFKVHGMRFGTPEGTAVVGADRIILALGQLADPPVWLGSFGIITEPDGRIRVDAKGRTSHARIWAGGDNILGPNLAVNAMATGLTAAEGILSRFSPVAQLIEGVGVKPPSPRHYSQNALCGLTPTPGEKIQFRRNG